MADLLASKLHAQRDAMSKIPLRSDLHRSMEDCDSVRSKEDGQWLQAGTFKGALSHLGRSIPEQLDTVSGGCADS